MLAIRLPKRSHDASHVIVQAASTGNEHRISSRILALASIFRKKRCLLRFIRYFRQRHMITDSEYPAAFAAIVIEEIAVEVPVMTTDAMQISTYVCALPLDESVRFFYH